MGWTAHTSFRDLKPGAVFVLMHSPTLEGVVVNPGDEFYIARANQVHVPADVLDASLEKIVLQVPGARFTMTPWQEGDLDPLFQTSLPHQAWVAREVELT